MFANENPRFLVALLTNPKATIERQLNVHLGNAQVKVLVERPDTMYVVVPFVPASEFCEVDPDDAADASIWDVLPSVDDNRSVGDAAHGSGAAA